MSPTARSSNYILFSDVHLGADLVQHIRPWTAERLRQLAKVDRDLTAMLEHYRACADPERPWRLVIAGDLVDLVGMSIAPGPDAGLSLTREEKRHGLGSSAAHAAAKMRAVAERHAGVFDRLAAFVADGHSLVIVRGNHDVELHWEAARAAFVNAIARRAPDGVSAEEVADRIEVHPWFYYEEGLIYVEHGHQFDAMCSYHHLLNPVSPLDPDRISPSFSDVLLRWVVRPTPGLPSHGHEGMGFVDYLRLGWSFGVRGALRLGYRYLTATGRALARWRAHVSAAAVALREEHERRMEALAESQRMGIDVLRALAALWPTPVTRGGFAVLRSMFLDRVALIVLVALMSLAVVFALPWSWAAGTLGVIGVAALFFVLVTGRQRGADLDPTQHMRAAARRIAEILPTRFIVMGHTHEPTVLDLSDTSTYVNLGNWGSDSPDEDDASRTHLVLRWIGDELRSEFLRWVPEEGPAPVPAPAPAED